MDEHETAGPADGGWRHGVTIAGMAFAVLFVAGLLTSAGTPDYDAPPQEWADWYTDSGNRGMQVISMLLLVLSALSLLVFAAGLYRRLRSFSLDRHGWPLVALAAGVVLATLITVSAVAMSTVSAAMEFSPTDFPVPGADVAQVLEQLGFGVLLLGGGWAAALFVAAVSLSARGTAALPAWMATAGLVVAVLLLASVAFLPMLLLPIWALVVSFLGLKEPATS